jgi:hypothetical protein
LPELVNGETTVAMIADFLRRNPAGIEFGLSSALDRASTELKRQDELDLKAQEQSLRYRGRIAVRRRGKSKNRRAPPGDIPEPPRFGGRPVGGAVYP